MDLHRNKTQVPKYLIKSQILTTFQQLNPQKNRHNQIQHRQVRQKKSQKIILTLKNPFLRTKPVLRIRNKQVQQKWYILLSSPINLQKHTQIIKLISNDTCIPQKVMPWLVGNALKVNAKLFVLKRQQYRKCINFNQPNSLQSNNSRPLVHIHQKINNTQLAQLIGTFLVYREDIAFSPLLMNITISFNYYLKDRPVTVLKLLLTLLSSQVYIGFLTKNPRLVSNVIQFIGNNVRKNCISASFFVWNNLNIQYYVKMWIESFWLPIAQDGTPLRQKILFYLLLQKFSKKSICKLCEATITSLSHKINMGNTQLTKTVLQQPKKYLDQSFFIHYLLKQE